MKELETKNRQNIQAEKDLHEQKFFVDSGHWTSHPLLMSRERYWLKYEVEKIRFYGYLYRYMEKKPYKNKAKILLAPIGDGSDLKYLQGMYREVWGIDISPAQLSKCPGTIIKKEGDILKSGYEDESFDIIIVSLFLHHLYGVDMGPFMDEFKRLLRKGGTIAFLEPSSMHPFNRTVRLVEKFLGAFPGKVKDERPISPVYVKRLLKNAGFQNVRIHGMSFNHIAYPFFIQSLANTIDPLFRAFWPIKFFSATIGFFCEKPMI